MRKIARREVGLAVLELNARGGLALHLIVEVRGTQRDIHIVVSVSVHERGFARRHFNAKNPDEFVFQHEVMMWLVGDFDFARLRAKRKGEDRDESEECCEVDRREMSAPFHARDSSTGVGEGVAGGLALRFWL